MKKSIVSWSLVLFVAAGSVAGCESATEEKADKVSDARENLADAKQELKNALSDSASDYLKFRAESEQRLRENDSAFVRLKEKMKTVNKAVKAKFDKQLEELNLQNEKLKMGIADYTYTANDKWETFKAGFNHSVDELGKSISTFVQNNKPK